LFRINCKPAFTNNETLSSRSRAAIMIQAQMRGIFGRIRARQLLAARCIQRWFCALEGKRIASSHLKGLAKAQAAAKRERKARVDKVMQMHDKLFDR
jgi:hypothetical protein